jgi:hypothetical protein
MYRRLLLNRNEVPFFTLRRRGTARLYERHHVRAGSGPVLVLAFLIILLLAAWSRSQGVL